LGLFESSIALWKLWQKRMFPGFIESDIGLWESWEKAVNGKGANAPLAEGYSEVT